MKGCCKMQHPFCFYVCFDAGDTVKPGREVLMNTVNAIELKNITKRFGQVIANDGVNLILKKGEILSVLGENGSGKTTLMNILSGIYFPDEGKIFVNGKEVVIRSPKDSFALGIGMVHQHFKLIDVLTAAENIILGLPGKLRLQMNHVIQDVQDLAKQYGFELDCKKRIYEMSVSEKQTVEILKTLYRGSDILILDEPTAVLTPQETDKLFAVLRKMRDSGHSIIIITHKLEEVLSLSDRVSVLRKGKSIGTVETKDATEDFLAEMMVGKKVSLNIERPTPENPKKILELKHVSCVEEGGTESLKDISLTAMGGEILGVAGVAGSGQKELLEVIAGLKSISKGEISCIDQKGEEICISKTKMEQLDRAGIKIAFVPEDRLGMGLVASMDITDNMLLRSFRFDNKFFANRKVPKSLAKKIIEQLKIVTPGVSTPVGRLSGGNVQKVLVGREIFQNPRVLLVAYPVRGLDIHSSYQIYHLLNEQKKQGVAVICIIEDLDVLLELSDRIAVLCDGCLTGIVDARTATKEQIGLLMTKKAKEANYE